MELLAEPWGIVKTATSAYGTASLSIPEWITIIKPLWNIFVSTPSLTEVVLTNEWWYSYLSCGVYVCASTLTCWCNVTGTLMESSCEWPYVLSRWATMSETDSFHISIVNYSRVGSISECIWISVLVAYDFSTDSWIFNTINRECGGYTPNRARSTTWASWRSHVSKSWWALLVWVCHI